MNNKIKALVTFIVIIALFLTGTFAWINFAQEMTNEWEGGGKPGGTTHDDFCKPKKEVYIENWGSVPLIVRIRLDEYMEIGEGAGLKGNFVNGSWVKNTNNHSVSLLNGANINDKSTWQPHIPVAGDPTACDPANPDFHDYWKWTMGGWKFYRMAPSPQRETLSYVDQNTSDYNNASGNIKQTLNATVLTMDQWKALGSPVGQYWVIDSDGWAYWAQLLMPGEATGLLLKKVELVNDPDDSYYYAINVIAQMATRNKSGDGLNYGNYEDFYSDSTGNDPDHSATDDGEDLLNKVVGDGSGNGGGSGSGAGGINSDNGVMIGSKLYLKQGATANLTKKQSVFGSDDITWTRKPVSTTNFNFNTHGNEATVTASVTAAIGAKLEVTATSVPSPTKAATITVIVIDKNAAGVVVGGDGNLYLDWGDNTFTKLDPDTGMPVGDMLCGGMDQKPGTADDRYDIVYSKNGEKLLGPNANGSYQSKGPDGKLGTSDDIMWWLKDPNKPVGDANWTGDENGDFTQTPPSGVVITSIIVSPTSATVLKGETQQFTATVKKSDGTNDNGGVTWSVTPSSAATISSGGLLTIKAGATATSVIVTATSITNPAVSSSPVTVTIEPDVYCDINNAQNGDTIVIDGREWIKVRNDSPSGTNYVLLMLKDTIGSFVYSSNDKKEIQFKESQIKNNLDSWWKNLNSPNMKKMAVEADIGVNESESWPSSGTGYYAHLPRHVDVDPLPPSVRYIDKTYWLATPTTDESGAVGFQKTIKANGTYGINMNSQKVEARPIVWVDISKLPH